MARPWWQRLKRTNSQNPIPESQFPGRIWDLGFEISDSAKAGWWLRAESKPVRVGLVAAATALPALLRAWTFNTPEAIEAPVPRGDDRLALLCEWGMEFGWVC